ncbi:MAG TPA: BON domain-containing protein [Albitalea sp.]
MTISKRCLAGLLSSVLVLGTVGCANTTVGQKIDDTTITTKVKTALLADPDVKGLQVNVDTVDGQVQLSGFVDSAAQARRAVDIASRVDGVKRVENKMSVKQ